VKFWTTVNNFHFTHSVKKETYSKINISTLYEQDIPCLTFQVPNIRNTFSICQELLADYYINTLRAMDLIPVEV